MADVATWASVLAAVDDALVNASSVNQALGAKIRTELAAAGSRWVARGSHDVLLESPEHAAWAAAMPAMLMDYDQIARQAEGEAKAKVNGASRIDRPGYLGPALLLPEVAVPISDRLVTETRAATAALTGANVTPEGNFVYVPKGLTLISAVRLGVLGNALTVSPLTEGVSQVVRVSLGAYSEIVSARPESAASSLLLQQVASSAALIAPFSSPVSFTGATNEAGTILQRLNQARTLAVEGIGQLVSPGTLTVVADAIRQFVRLPREPAYYVSAYYQRDAGGVTLGAVQERLVAAIVAAQAWLEVVP